MDVNLGAQELSLNPLVITDQESNATLAVSIKEGEFGFEFKDLDNGTLDRLFARNQLFGGSLTGDLTLHVIPTRMQNSTADGTLDGQGPVVRPDARKTSHSRGCLARSKRKLAGAQNSHVPGAGFSNRTEGNRRIIADQVQLDLDLFTDGIDWNQLRKYIPSKCPEGKKRATPPSAT